MPFVSPGAPASPRRPSMKNPLDSLWGTIITGLVLTVILVALAKNLI
jgi:hypothetical protein